MGHIACMTTGLTGMRNASLALVAQLEKAGHQVTYLCPWDIRKSIEAQGYTYIQLPQVNFNPGPPPSSTLSKYFKTPAKAKSDLQKGIDALGMNTFKEIVLELNPDLCIVDMELHEHILTLHGLNIPQILLSQWFSVWQKARAPSTPSCGCSRKRFSGTRLGMLWSWWQRAFKKGLRIQLNRLFQRTDRRAVLKTYARKLGFPTRELDPYKFPPPFVYRTLPVLSMTAWEMEFPHKPRPNLHYIGPMIHTARAASAPEEGMQTALEAIFHQKMTMQKY